MLVSVKQTQGWLLGVAHWDHRIKIHGLMHLGWKVVLILWLFWICYWFSLLSLILRLSPLLVLSFCCMAWTCAKLQNSIVLSSKFGDLWPKKNSTGCNMRKLYYSTWLSWDCDSRVIIIITIIIIIIISIIVIIMMSIINEAFWKPSEGIPVSEVKSYSIWEMAARKRASKASFRLEAYFGN